MIRFKYDDIEADKLILEFKCKECHSLTKTDQLTVPELDFNTFKGRSYSYKHKCQCGACYSIEIVNGLYESYGLIHRLFGKEADIFVYEVPDFLYDKDSILVDTIESFTRIKSIISGIEGMSKDDKNYVYCLLFTNLITILDSYIKIFTEPIILNNDSLIDSFSKVFGMPKGNKEEKIIKIRNFYKSKSFQSVTSQKKLFNDVFDINVDIDARIEKYVAIRDIIIHRNAFDIEGYVHKIKKSQLLQELDILKDYIGNIYRALKDFENKVNFERITNRL